MITMEQRFLLPHVANVFVPENYRDFDTLFNHVMIIAFEAFLGSQQRHARKGNKFAENIHTGLLTMKKK